MSAKGKKSKKKSSTPVLQKVVFWIALLVFLGSGGYLVKDLIIDPQSSEGNYSDYRSTYSEDTNTPSADDSGVWSSTVGNYEPERLADGTLKSFESLIAMNSDIVGWITVPNTVIDYPVVQCGDNDYYLKRNINKEKDRNGTIFADYRNVISYEESSKNIILYGHHMRSGIMFQNLINYDKLSFYKKNPVITFNTKYNEDKWVIFSKMKINTLKRHGKPFNFMRTDFVNDEDFMSFVSDVRARSMIDTTNQIDVSPDDELLTMSTCSYEYDEFRTVLVARKLRPGEETVDVSTVTKAKNPIMPDVWGS